MLNVDIALATLFRANDDSYLDGTALGHHTHRCHNCGETWSHDGLAMQTLPDEEFEKQHTCSCGIKNRTCLPMEIK